ncbi:leucine-rich repeat domain-containing protein [Dapis sp. BLCC M172]|uniref:leucine-rich repeat domain-containing protein n=1 Tax=Dapis sp. BLCC M172 TaxID=2975281 RepID=UPI003CE97C63
MSQLSNLTTLYLGGNQLTKISESISQLSNLTTLYLGENQLTKIPQSISQLSNLTRLYLDNNQLTKIPESISQLYNLDSLNLKNNQLTTIPESVCQLSSLKELYLNSNQLTKIPESSCQLSNLTRLDLYRNQLTKIPESSCQLSSLKELNLRNNPLKSPPREIAEKGIKAIEEYFQRQIFLEEVEIEQKTSASNRSNISLKRAKKLIEFLINYSQTNDEGSKLSTEWIERNSDRPQLEITTNLRELACLLNPEISSKNSNEANRQKNQIRDTINRLKELEIVTENSGASNKSKGIRSLIFSLWHSQKKEENLEQLELVWKNRIVKSKNKTKMN